jgi:hypothetical protein
MEIQMRFFKTKKKDATWTMRIGNTDEYFFFTNVISSCEEAGTSVERALARNVLEEINSNNASEDEAKYVLGVISKEDTPIWNTCFIKHNLIELPKAKVRRSSAK